MNECVKFYHNGSSNNRDACFQEDIADVNNLNAKLSCWADNEAASAALSVNIIL
jgi:hypothetical protein